MFENLLIGVKPDLEHRQWIGVAVAAATPGARIHLVSLVRVGKEGDESERRRKAVEVLDELAERLRADGFQASTEVEMIGVAASHELVRIAEERDTDLIALGLGKRSRVGKALLGSDAQTVIIAAPCPVITTRVDG